MLFTLQDPNLSLKQDEILSVSDAEQGVISKALEETFAAFCISEMKLYTAYYTHAMAHKTHKWTVNELITTIKLIK